MKLSIIIPVFNEELTIEHIIQKVSAIFLGDIVKEIIVVNDGSTDQTRQILHKYHNHPVVKVFNLEKNQGKTAALVEGINNAQGDIILIQDADLEYNPEDFPALLKPILSGEFWVVYGSRFKGTIKRMAWINRAANVFSNMIFNVLYGTRLSDINTCYKVFKKEALSGIKIVSTNFTFETEITAKLLHRGIKIIEVPIDYTARSVEEGKKISWKTAMSMFWGIIKYRFQK